MSGLRGAIGRVLLWFIAPVQNARTAESLATSLVDTGTELNEVAALYPMVNRRHLELHSEQRSQQTAQPPASLSRLLPGIERGSS